MNRWRRGLGKALAWSGWVAGLALGAVACNPAPSTPATAPVKKTVTLLHYFSAPISGILDEVARGFSAQNTAHDLKPVLLDHEAFKTSIGATLASGNPPDLYTYWAGARTAAIANDLLPIDGIWQQANLDARFAPSLVRAASEHGGKKYLIPLTQHYVAFFYNKQVFAAHGVQPPTTWAAFVAVCEQLKRAGVTPIALGAKDKWPAQFWFDLLLLRTAPFEFRQQLMAGQVGYGDARVRAVFDRWAMLLDKGCFNPAPNDQSWDTGANEMVFSGQAAMTLMGSWNIGYFSDAEHQWVPGQDFDFFPFPRIDEHLPPVALGPIDGVVLPKQALNAEGAQQALVFLADVAAQQAISRGSGALAANTQVPRGFYSGIQQRMLAEIERSPHFAFNYDLATPPAVAALGLDAFSEFLAFPQSRRRIVDQLAADAALRFAESAGER